jgi:FkbM family methyltransferase
MKLIKSKYNHFLSVPEPYMRDKFVAENYLEVDVQPDIRSVSAGYSDWVARNALLRNLLRLLHAWAPEENRVVEIIDLGVYMGTFSIGIELVARQMRVPVSIAAYEANPELISPIRSNIELYGCTSSVVHAAVGRKLGVIEFVWSQDGAIGGTVFNTQNKKKGAFHSTEVPVTPLARIIEERKYPSLVKIDIEGNEVSAFASFLDRSTVSLDHIFIVEFAPWQFEQKMSADKIYGDFLLENFQVINIANWMSGKLCEPIDTHEKLRNCVSGQRSFNTDLLLIPANRRLAPGDLLSF